MDIHKRRSGQNKKFRERASKTASKREREREREREGGREGGREGERERGREQVGSNNKARDAPPLFLFNPPSPPT